jgi:tRNA-(ms[2]io[6]A)-hydroxylase
VLHLASRTDPSWVGRAMAHLDEVLLDHAHCEKKAASTAINLIFRYPDHASLMRPLSALAREELEHFETMLKVLDARGIPFRRQKPSAYAGRLMKVVRAGEPARMLDTLLVCAFIEARSCERMQLLSAAFADPLLEKVYCELLAAEARHHTTYVGLAEEIFGGEATAERLETVALHEAQQLAEAYPEDRLHG